MTPGARSGRRSGILLLAACALSLASPGCGVRKPNLARLYERAPRPRRAVILIPGAFGSRLRDPATGALIWGDTPSLFKRLYRPGDASEDLLDLPIGAANPLDNRDGLEPAGIFDRVVGRSLYGRIFSALDEAGHYTPGEIRDPKPGEDLFTFDYDWRRDVAQSAGLLDEAIRRILAARGEPDGRVDLVAHSLGGLIARYYVRFGGEDVLDRPPQEPSYAGARHVENLVFVGTPNAGTLDALESIVQGARIVRRLPAGAIFTMPSAYELMPHPDEPIVLDERGETLEADIFDEATWRRFGWSIFGAAERDEGCREIAKREGSAAGDRACREREARRERFLAWALARARRLVEALESPGGLPDPVTYVAFGGDCEPTPARLAVVRQPDGSFATYFDPEDLPRELRKGTTLPDRMLEPGDGSVTRASLLGGKAFTGGRPGDLALDYAGFFCENHRLLTEESTFQDNLLHLLLERP